MRSFLGFGQQVYIGQPYAQAVKLAGIACQIIPLTFPWLAYGASTLAPNVNVGVDCRTKVCDPLDQIRSIYIDNLGSSVPVYVYFPDTGYTVAAKANSEGWYPAFTNSKVVWVIGEGFLTGNIPQTLVVLCNARIEPNVNVELDQSKELWLASPVVTRGTSIYNTSLGTPALGDQTVNYTPVIGGTGPILSGLWGTPHPSGFIYLTHASLSLIQMTANNFGVGTLEFVVESTGASGTLYDVVASINQNTFVPQIPILQFSSMNVKLNATETWRIRAVTFSNLVNGVIFSSAWNYTYQP